MNPAYTLAIKFGIPVIVQPEWDECQKLQADGSMIWWKGRNLWDEGHRIWKEGEIFRKEGQDLLEKGNNMWKKGWKLYRKAVSRELGPEYAVKIDWNTGEVRPL